MQSEHSKRFVIVVGIDDSPEADAVLELAVDAAQRNVGAELHVVHAIDIRSGVPAVLEGARRYLDGIHDRLTTRLPEVAIRTHLGVSTPAREIIQLASNLAADLVVVGTHGRTGVSRALLGSQAELVVRQASCPVLVARQKRALVDVPDIEPPCQDCLAEQAASAGKTLWCSRHSEHHPRAHRHYEFPEAFGRGSALIRTD